MRVQGQQAVVLHTRPWSESSRLVDLFSRDYGRVRVIAKGCRRRKSRTRAALMPFRVLITGWSGKGELPTLTAAEVPLKPLLIQGRALLGAWYMNELLLRFLARMDAHPALYDQYLDSLENFAADTPVDVVLRHFECRLLSDIGYGLYLDREAESNKQVDPGKDYLYVIDRGPVALTDSVREPSLRESAIRVNGQTLIGLASGKLHEFGSREEARALMRAALSRQLDGKPLRSRLYLNQLSQFDKRVSHVPEIASDA